MGSIILILGLAIGLATFLFMLLARFATWSIAKIVESRMRAAECIVNSEKIPGDWLAPHIKKRDELLARGAGPDELARLGRRIQKDCIKQINDLLRYFENDRIVDSAESRQVLLKALQKEKKIWEESGWGYFLAGMPTPESAKVLNP